MIEKQYVVCVNNEGYPASLEMRKIYEVMADDESNAHGMIRVVDESGEDYLYPNNFFLPIEVSSAIAHAFYRAS